MAEVSNPFEVFKDIDGDPLKNGYIYIGNAGANAEANPIAVYFDKDSSIPAAQPIRTVNGYASNNGTPSKLYTGTDDYSITVRNKNGSLVYSSLVNNVPSKDPNVNALGGNAVFTDTTQFATGTTKDGVLSDSTLLDLVGTTTKCRTEGFHAGTTVGEETYIFLNEADSVAAGYEDGKSRFQCKGLDVYACLVLSDDISVESVGAVADFNGTTGTDVGQYANHILSLEANAVIPNGDWYQSTQVTITGGKITLSREAVLNVERGVTAFLINGNDTILDFGYKGTIQYIKSDLTDFTNANDVAIKIEKSGYLTYTRAVVVKNIIIRNSYRSIQANTVFYLTFENVETFDDYRGITLNKELEALESTPDVSLPTTTLTFKRCYFHGANGSTSVTGTKAFDMVGIVQVAVIGNLTTEWYDIAGTINTIQTGDLSHLYIEECNTGIDIANVTGTLECSDWYTNEVGNYTIKLTSGRIAWYGGRGIVPSGAVVFSRGANADFVIINPPKIAGAGTQGLNDEDTLLNNQQVISPVINSRNSGLMVSIPSSGTPASTNSQVTLRVNHSEAGSTWRTFSVEVLASTISSTGGGNNIYKSVRSIGKDSSSISLGTQSDIVGSGIITISAIHQSSTQTDIVVTLNGGGFGVSWANTAHINISVSGVKITSAVII